MRDGSLVTQYGIQLNPARPKRAFIDTNHSTYYTFIMATAEKWRHFEPLPADIEARLSRLNALFVQEGVLLAYLFGSLLQTDRPAQDADLALLMPKDKRPYHLHQAITDCLDTERVDIVDLRRASPVLKFEIISNGRCLYAQNEDVEVDFVMASLRQYHDTNYLRQQQNKILKERLNRWSSKEALSPNG